MNNKKLLSCLLGAALSLPGFAAEKPKNIIIMIGDGMGFPYTTGYRHFVDSQETTTVETTVFDRLHVGSASTHPHHHDGVVTDSAASATALATGTKTYNGAIAVDIEKEPLTTVMEIAKAKGMNTGLAVTSTITHATPASFFVHNEYRKNEKEIAQSLTETPADVMFGNGRHFTQAQLDTLAAKGYQVISEYKQLASLKPGKVMATMPLTNAIDDEPMRLTKMTKQALKQLKGSKQGFVLLIEGSQIDWAGHANDIAWAMHEMADYGGAVEAAEAFVKANPDTLLIGTADHSTGGLTLARDGDYRWEPQSLLKIKQSPEAIAKIATTAEDPVAIINRSLPFKLNDEQLKLIKNTDLKEPKALTNAIKKVIDLHTGTGWTTSGHTGEDVPVYATGVGAHLFSGHLDNTDIADKIIKLLQ
ncbi:alkaline phosphatase [Paraferrimonas sp. SM1919]|uniref:alkaline phosphatase n=1 Tax=Paraferrimonas sp. SM1919 TaxID=2662263 RepID=UPI0013D3D16B|nr:alkaline phosphatase [Paraferrimonas sp. SM1919]